MSDVTPARSSATRPWRLGVLSLGALLLAALSGCGFHLRGKVEIPPSLNPVFIEAIGGSLVQRALEDALAGSDIHLTAKRSEAKLILRIPTERRSSRVAAVDVNGKTLAFELHYVVRFDAVGADQRQLVPPQSLDLFRNFDNPDVEVLGKQLEQELIYQDLATDAADRILMRLRATLVGRQ